MPEYARSALEALREPLECGHITISRAARQREFPARFQLLAAMNPCPCGHHGDPRRACRCTPEAIERYQGRLSGPLLDRIDLHVEVPAVPPQALAAAPDGPSSATVRERVAAARAASFARQGGSNAALGGAALEQHARLEAPVLSFLQGAARQLQWSARSYHRVLRVARTIADLDHGAASGTLADAPIRLVHVAEAVQLRRGVHPAGGPGAAR